MKKGKKNKSRKLNIKRILIVLVFVLILAFTIYKISKVTITNIYISGNSYLTDQEVIDIAGLKNYPNSINNMAYKIKNRLEKNDFIIKAKVEKKGLRKVYIKIEENYPLFYYLPEDRTILYDGTKIKDKILVPTVINKIPNKVYDKFIKKLEQTNKDVLYRMSEIEYSPNDVDNERFFILMNDGNYVYLTVYKFLKINKYVDIINAFENKKGILYLDSGEYFDVFD